MNIMNKNTLNLSSSNNRTNNNISFASKADKAKVFITKAGENFLEADIEGIKKGINNVSKKVEPMIKEKGTEKPSPILKAYGWLVSNVTGPLAEKYCVKENAIKKDSNLANKALTLESIILLGNAAKELMCMILYPTMTIVNQDLPTDKKRFVGIYDFFVTVFSFTGTLLFGMELTKNKTDSFLEKALFKHRGNNKFDKALKGLKFVTTIALQTLFCKRILAPALSPPLAAKVRKNMEANDAKKAGKPQFAANAPANTPAGKPVEAPVFNKEIFAIYNKSVNKSAEKA
jgi:hypothetical protein